MPCRLANGSGTVRTTIYPERGGGGGGGKMGDEEMLIPKTVLLQPGRDLSHQEERYSLHEG
jgi:hypothetical protein